MLMQKFNVCSESKFIIFPPSLTAAMSSSNLVLCPILTISERKKSNYILRLWAPSRVTFPNMAEHWFWWGLVC